MLTFQELQEASLTEASTELEQVLVSVCGGKTPKKKFSNVLKQAQKNGFETAEELGEAILKDAGISLNSSARMSENGPTDPDWEGDNNTSKTDIHLGKYDISLKSIHAHFHKSTMLLNVLLVRPGMASNPHFL